MIAHPGIILAVAATVVYNFGFILEKRALAHLPPSTRSTSGGWRAFVHRTSVAGRFRADLRRPGAASPVLSLEPLTVAQPLQACGVVVTIVLSRLVCMNDSGVPSWPASGSSPPQCCCSACPSATARARATEQRDRDRHRGGCDSGLPGGPGHILLRPPGVQPTPLPDDRGPLRPVRRVNVRSGRTRSTRGGDLHRQVRAARAGRGPGDPHRGGQDGSGGAARPRGRIPRGCLPISLPLCAARLHGRGNVPVPDRARSFMLPMSNHQHRIPRRHRFMAVPRAATCWPPRWPCGSGAGSPRSLCR